MNKILYITILMMSASLCTSCVQEYVDENDKHYDSGKIAYECYVESVNRSAGLFHEAKVLDDFLGFLEENTLPDKSNELQVWLEAEQKYYPLYKQQRNHDIWYIAQNLDTLCIIDTNGDRLNTSSAGWLIKKSREGTFHTLSYIGDGKWNMVVNDYQCNNNPFYYSMKTNANFVFSVRDSACYEITGSNKIVLADKDKWREDVLILTSSLSTPLVYKVKPSYSGSYHYSYDHNCFIEGDFSFLITDPATNENETVDVTIVSISDKDIDVYITYKDDVVVI